MTTEPSVEPTIAPRTTTAPRDGHRPSALRAMLLVVARELRQYFRTWSGYIVIALLLLPNGLLYNVFAIRNTSRYSSDVLSDFFYYASGCTIIAALLLSMRLVAEERQAGTLPLLTTSSLTDGQIVLAKFFSAFAMLFLYLLLTTYMPALIFLNGKVSLGHIAAGYVGLALFGASGIAIGLFGSALASSQLVAFLISGVITATMLLLWLTSKVVDGALADVIAYLALHDKHFRPFMDGTIALQSIVYYFCVIAFFLMLARNALEVRRWRP